MLVNGFIWSALSMCQELHLEKWIDYPVSHSLKCHTINGVLRLADCVKMIVTLELAFALAAMRGCAEHIFTSLGKQTMTKLLTNIAEKCFLFSAQREGFLSEAHSEEVDQADPFYAHCKLHSDKTLVKKRRKNYLSIQLRTHYRRLQMASVEVKNSTEQLRIQRKLEKQRVNYFSLKSLKQPPWGKFFLLSSFVFPRCVAIVCLLNLILYITI